MLSQDRKYRYLQKQENLDYSKGYNSYLANDVVPENVLIYATDSRISTLGRQKTRQGNDFYSVPAGETLDQSQTSATGAADKSFTVTTWLAAKVTAGATGRATKLDIEIKNDAGATGPVIVTFYSDASGSPGTIIGQSSIPASTPTTSYAYSGARLIEAPQQVSSTAYWVVASVQSDGSGSYKWNSTTSATTSKVSTNSGVTWSSTSYALHVKTYVSTDSPTLGRFRAHKSDGTSVMLIAYKEAGGTTAVATINDATGVLTSIKTGLSANATRYKFALANDIVYYVNGFDAPRKWDFTTEAACGGSPAISDDIFLHKNRMFYFQLATCKVFFSNIADFETFTSTDFIFIPATKSSDPIVGNDTLNDNLYIITRRKKWGLYGSDLQNMTLREVPGSKGCVGSDTLQKNGNHLYFCSEDGFYRFNGSTDELLSEAITNEYQSATNKDDLGSGFWNNRYYVFFTPSGEAHNSQCWVYNTTYNSMESRDLATYVQKTIVWDGGTDTGQFLQCSNLVAAIYYAEQPSNQFNNLGHALSWEIRTKYDHFGNPATNKHVKRWYPRFQSADSNYSVTAQYDKDFAGAPTDFPVSLGGNGTLWGSGALWGSFTWGTRALISPRLTVPGLNRYLQRRYKCAGVNKPAEFLGDTLYYFIKRPR